MYPFDYDGNPLDEENGVGDEHECTTNNCTNIAHYDAYEEWRAAMVTHKIEYTPAYRASRRFIRFAGHTLITAGTHYAVCGHAHLISSIQTAWHASKRANQ